MGRNGTKLKNLNRDILKKLAAYVDDVIMKQKPSSRSGADLLKSYSPWLASFKSSEFEEVTSRLKINFQLSHLFYISNSKSLANIMV